MTLVCEISNNMKTNIYLKTMTTPPVDHKIERTKKSENQAFRIENAHQL